MFIGTRSNTEGRKAPRLADHETAPWYGRFMQADPLGYEDGINWYAYVKSDPVNRTDPGGRFGLDLYRYDRHFDDGGEEPPIEVTACGRGPWAACLRPDWARREPAAWMPCLNPYVCKPAGPVLPPPASPPPGEKKVDCGKPPASQTYPLPPGYKAVGPGNIYIRKIGAPRGTAPIQNPAYTKAWSAASAKGIDYAGAGKDLGGIALDVGFGLGIGAAVKRFIGGIFGEGAGKATATGSDVGITATQAISSVVGDECSR